MDKVQIEFVSRQVDKVKNYEQMTVTYKSVFGKIETRKLISFGTNEEVWNRLNDAKKGDSFEIDRDNDKFKSWTAIAKIDSIAVATPQGRTAPEGQTYADRLAFEVTRQNSIVRQTCVKAAVEYMAAFGKGTTFTPEQVCEVAAVFENYVNGKNIAGLTDDIPE